MTDIDRRKLLQVAGVGALSAALPASVARALAIPAHRRTGTIADVEHVVILMQENRSFDHYFGTLNGVRGFGDPRAARLPSGKPVWRQSGGSGEVLPFRPAFPNVGLAFLPDPPHGWNDSHVAWNDGKYDQWVTAKGSSTMSYLTRGDLPFHFALAEAFTICDAYYCSLIGPTDPNRYHLWTGWTGNDGTGGGPVVSNAELGYDWSTFPERLEMAGISWKIYQDVGVGLDASGSWGWTEDAHIGNYGDNSLLYFHQYQNAPPGTPLADRAKTGTAITKGGTLFDVFQTDIRAGRLPKVSWLVAPEAYSEHPNWPANYGAWYIARILEALTEDPAVWSKTALFISYDENGGFFDHMVPPTPPRSPEHGASTVSLENEVFGGDVNFVPGPYGLGSRVPMLVVSPWSKGGWVSSEVFDHTSLLRFLEARFGLEHAGLRETNITPWRRAVVGDLTSLFDFDRPDREFPPLPSTEAFAPAGHARHDDDRVTPPVVQEMPVQERGVRRARPVPYRLHTEARDKGDGTLELEFGNSGRAAAVFQIRSASSLDAPRTYTVEPGKRLSGLWVISGGFDLEVFGPNGYFRSYRGGPSGAILHVEDELDDLRRGVLHVTNRDSSPRRVVIANGYSRVQVARLLAPGETYSYRHAAIERAGWYDLSITADGTPFRSQLAGHVETGEESLTDPAIG